MSIHYDDFMMQQEQELDYQESMQERYERCVYALRECKEKGVSLDAFKTLMFECGLTAKDLE